LGDANFDLGFHNTLFDYLAGYLIIKHVFNSNLTAAIDWIDTDDVVISSFN